MPVNPGYGMTRARGVPAPFLFPAICAIASITLGATPARATDRLHRIYDQQHGLPTDTVNDVAQDSKGFLWIATAGGLVRFDGSEMRRWGGRLSTAVDLVRAGPDGEVVSRTIGRVLFRVLPEGGAEEIRMSDGGAIDAVADVRFDGDGTLWIVRPHE